MPEGPRVLIVEDDADLRSMFRLALRLAGYAVLEAGDGLDALHLLDGSTPPDAIILDLGLPRISGYSVQQEIASQAHLRHIPVIVVTGQPGPHDDLHVACVLRKPATPDRLITVVRSCIAAGSPSLANSATERRAGPQSWSRLFASHTRNGRADWNSGC